MEVLNARTVQTNEVGRSALLGPALTWAVGDEPVQLVDVGCSAGLNMLCDRYRFDYGAHGVTGPADSPVRIDCQRGRRLASDRPVPAGDRRSGGHRP